MNNEPMVKLQEEGIAKVNVGFDLTSYLGGREYDRKVFIQEVRHYCEMTLTGMLEAGKRLLCIKIMEGHGRYHDALDEIGIPYQRANELVRIAQMVNNRLLPRLPHDGNLKRLENMGKKRLQLLTRLTDEELAEFEDDEGAISEEKLDEIAVMPVKQLREYVRELKKRNENGMKQNTRLKTQIEKWMKEAKPELKKLKKIKAWTDKIFGLATEIMIAMNDGNAPDKGDFEGEEGQVAQAEVGKLDVIFDQINYRFSSGLKKEWGIE